MLYTRANKTYQGKTCQGKLGLVLLGLYIHSSQCFFETTIHRFQGWEYSIDTNWVGFGPVEKTYHIYRRRRWVRERKMVTDVQKAENEKVHYTRNCSLHKRPLPLACCKFKRFDLFLVVFSFHATPHIYYIDTYLVIKFI